MTTIPITKEEKTKAWLQKRFGMKFFVKPTPLMWFAQVFLWIITFGQHKNFMDNYATMVGSTRLYLKRGSNGVVGVSLGAHEGQHCVDKEEDGLFKYFVKYCIPKYRAEYEMRAYKTSYAIRIRMGEKITKPSEHRLDSFTTSAYFWMDRDRDRVRHRLQAGIDLANMGCYTSYQHEFFRAVGI